VLRIILYRVQPTLLSDECWGQLVDETYHSFSLRTEIKMSGVVSSLLHTFFTARRLIKNSDNSVLASRATPFCCFVPFSVSSPPLLVLSFEAPWTTSLWIYH
jgi:hypothetical protein